MMKLIFFILELFSSNQEASTLNVIDGVFKNIGTFSMYKKLETLLINHRYYCFADHTGTRNSTTYYLSRGLQASFIDSMLLCHKFNMDMLTLETEKEYDNFQTIYKNNFNDFESMTHIGAIEVEQFSLEEKRNGPWMWLKSGQFVNTTNKWNRVKPVNSGADGLFLYKTETGFDYDEQYSGTSMDIFKYVCQNTRSVKGIKLFL